MVQNHSSSFLEISYNVFWSIQIHYEQSAYNCILCKTFETFYQLPQIYNLKFSFCDHYFRWSKVVKLGPIQIKLMKCPKLLLPISAAFVCFCSLQGQIILASTTFLLSKFSVSKKYGKNWQLQQVIFNYFCNEIFHIRT